MDGTKILKKVTLSVSDDLKIKGIANSLETSRDGFKLDSKSAESNVGKVLPLLLSHNWGDIPVGKVTMEEITDNGLTFTGELYQSIDNLPLIVENIKNQTLSVSIGGIKPAGKNGADDPWEILELSLTPVPADSAASVSIQDLNCYDIKNIQKMIKELIDVKTNTQAVDPKDKNANPKDNADNADSPTLQDVLDAVNAIAKDVTAIKTAVTKDSSDDTNDDSSDNSATEALKQEIRDILKQGLTGKTAFDLYKLAQPDKPSK